MIPTLQYMGRGLDPRPVNRTLEEVHELLLVDKTPVVVQLEPGDGTRYDWLLVPAASYYVGDALGVIGIPPGAAAEYLIIVDVHVPMHAMAVPFDGATTAADVREVSANAWTRTCLAWWLNVVHATVVVTPAEEGLGFPAVRHA